MYVMSKNFVEITAKILPRPKIKILKKGIVSIYKTLEKYPSKHKITITKTASNICRIRETKNLDSKKISGSIFRELSNS